MRNNNFLYKTLRSYSILLNYKLYFVYLPGIASGLNLKNQLTTRVKEQWFMVLKQVYTKQVRTNSCKLLVTSLTTLKFGFELSSSKNVDFSKAVVQKKALLGKTFCYTSS